MRIIGVMQRIQYAKTKSDCIAKVEGSFVPREKKRKQEERGDWNLIFHSLEAFNSISDDFLFSYDMNDHFYSIGILGVEWMNDWVKQWKGWD